MTTTQTIDGVPREFVREGRYIVVKPDYEDDIRTERLRNYIEEMCFHTPDCVVVEADWPEYEPVWRMIEARVIGNPTELDAAKATISQLQGLVAELRALLDAPVCKECEGVGYHVTMGVQRSCWACKPAAQPQGEPVAYLDLEKIQPAGMAYATKMRVNHRQTALYAEQPMPVEAERQTLLELQHELALLMNKHYRKPWCCKFASSTNGWNHDSNCKNFVVCF